MDPFGLTPDQYAAGAAWASVVVLTVTGALIYRQVAEAQRLRQQQSRPFVVVRWHMERFLILLRVENLGRTVAYDIQVSFDQPLTSKWLDDRDFADINMFRNGIPMLAPGQNMSLHFDVSHERAVSGLPMTYTATAQYRDGDANRYGPEIFVLDLDAYMDTAVSEKGMPELVKEVEELRKEVKKWTESASGGLRVYNIDRDAYRRRQDRPHRIRQALQIREREGLRGLVRHLGTRYRRIRGLYRA